MILLLMCPGILPPKMSIIKIVYKRSLLFVKILQWFLDKLSILLQPSTTLVGPQVSVLYQLFFTIKTVITHE
jgi:hypothetical protein